MKENCSSCIHNRGGCRNRDEDGLPFCNWEFDYERLDRRDPANWPDDSDFDERSLEMSQDSDAEVFEELRSGIESIQNETNELRRLVDRSFSRSKSAELRSIIRSIDNLLDEASDEVDCLEEEAFDE